MKKRFATRIILTLLLICTLPLAFDIRPSMAEPSVIASAHTSTIPVQAEQLVWSDEFNGSTIGSDWEHMIGDGTLYWLPAGWGNNELQYYTDRPENSYVSDGYLHIAALEEEYMGYNYTSARLRTKNRQDFLYGKIEARMKLPTTKGMWPAFWMMPTYDTYGGWAASGEIDIMEAFVSDFPKQIIGSIHYGGEWPDNVHQSYYYSEGYGPNQTDFSKDFHNYTIEWEPNEFRWYVDGNLYGTATSWWSSGGDYPAPFDQYFHILVNLAIGGNPVPAPDQTTVFPQELVIDYIRVIVNASPQTIYIRPDGSIDPSTASIQRDGDVYTLTGNIITEADGIVIERDNITLDGSGYTVQGTGNGIGINLTRRSNVTIKNTKIKAFYIGIHFYSSNYNRVVGNNITTNNGNGIVLSNSNNTSIGGNKIKTNNRDSVTLFDSYNNTVSGNNITTNMDGITIWGGVTLFDSYNNTVSGNNITTNNGVGIKLAYSSNNSIGGNNITTNNFFGIYLTYSSNNTVSGNNITDNYYGVVLIDSSNNNSVSGNNITNNRYGIRLYDSSNNSIYHNNFVNNTHTQATTDGSANFWDDNHKGNYWSNYRDRYPNATELDGSGIWDTPYVINENNQDNYPIIPEFPAFLILPLFMIVSLAAVVLKKRKQA